MITGKEIEVIKRLAQLFQGSKTVIHCGNIKTIAIMMPIAHKDTGVTTFFSGFGDIPIHEIFAVLIMH
jgi:hypothetical protein